MSAVGSTLRRIASLRRPPTAVVVRLSDPSRRLRIATSLLLGGAVWEIIGRYLSETSMVIVPASAVARSLVRLAASGELLHHARVSFIEFAAGFAIAAVVGILLGVLMALSPMLTDLLDPWVQGLYSTPVIAFSPMLIILFGIGIASKIAVVFLVAVFPILVNTLAGIHGTEPTLVEAVRSFGASPRQIFHKVVLPSALPFIIAGLRLGVGRGLVGVVVGELFGAKAGLGFLIMTSAEVFATADLFAGVLVLAASGIVSMEALKWLEQWLAPWRVQAVYTGAGS